MFFEPLYKIIRGIDLDESKLIFKSSIPLVHIPPIFGFGVEVCVRLELLSVLFELLKLSLIYITNNITIVVKNKKLIPIIPIILKFIGLFGLGINGSFCDIY